MGKCTTVDKTKEELANETTEVQDNTTLTNDIRAKLKGSYNVTLPGLAIGSTNTNVANVEFHFTIAGVQYIKAAVAAGTAPGNDIIPQAKYGAVALDIGANGTIDVIEAADNATGYDSAALAIAGIAAAASDHARMGTVTATKSDGAFTFGTTALDAANTTVVYTDSETNIQAIGAAITSLV